MSYTRKIEYYSCEIRKLRNVKSSYIGDLQKFESAGKEKIRMEV